MDYKAIADEAAEVDTMNDPDAVEKIEAILRARFPEPTVGDSGQREAERLALMCAYWYGSADGAIHDASNAKAEAKVKELLPALLASRTSEITANARDKAEAFAVRHNLDAYLIPPLAELLARPGDSTQEVPMALADLFVETIAMLQSGAHTGSYEVWLIRAWERLTGLDFIRRREEVRALPEVAQRVADARR
jgi:hypothetical protein